MITDPYEIDFLIAERIGALYKAGALDALTPEPEFGYTCEAVFGVCSGDIAAISGEYEGGSGTLWLHLTDGSIVPAVPVAHDPGSVLWRRIEH